MKTQNRKYAVLAGWSLLLMAVTAGYAYGYVHGNLIVPNDAIHTLSHLQKDTNLFGSEIMGWLIILITDLLVAWSLYRYFQQVQSTVSLLTGWVRAFYSVVLAVAIWQLVIVWQLLHTINPSAEEVMNRITTFEQYWSLGLIIFGLHLVGLGYLSIKSSSVPNWIGWLLYLAGISYSALNLAKAFASGSTEIIITIEMILAAPMALAEIGFAIWLVWKGGKTTKRK